MELQYWFIKSNIIYSDGQQLSMASAEIFHSYLIFLAEDITGIFHNAGLFRIKHVHSSTELCVLPIYY